MIEVYDANGNKIDRNTGTCNRCGSPIKYIYEYDGQTYGSTCIEAVSGIRPDDWAFRDGKFDQKATEEAQTEKAQRIQERQQAEAELQAKREEIRAANRERYQELINVLENAPGGFCSDMARQIETNGFSTELYEGILSPRQFQIVREIYGKAVGGRKNSKVYNEAVQEFDQKFDTES